MSEENSQEKDKKEKKEDHSNNAITVTNFRGSPKVLQISKGNYYYLINRENYDLTKIMMLIDYNRLSTLGQKFREYDGGIEKIIFCTLLTNILKTEKMPINELTDLIYGIYKFFAEIDFNGDNNMEWAEFTQFIIDKVEGEHNIGEEDKDKEGNVLSEKEIMKYKRYELSPNIRDVHIHKSDIIKASYVTKNNKLLINEYNSHLIKVYNPLNGHIEHNINIDTLNERNNNFNFADIKKTLSYYKGYSVISFTTIEAILAILLSNKYILFFNTFNFKDCELIFAIKAKSLQKRIWFLENHNIWVTSGDKEPEDDFYYINEIDVKFEIKGGYPIIYTNNLGYRTRYCTISKHKNEIYDVIEIRKPFLILTACLDGLIRLINTKDLEFLKTWNYHTCGVKHLDYNPFLENNGYIISTGFEYNIYLYNTDLSLDSSFKGKLEGHFVPLIDCKFINNTPMCASVDEEGNIRIWDVSLKICLQSIPNTKRNLLVNGLLILNKINKFIIFGNNMLFFESKYREDKESQDDIYEENHPIKISYNKYYQQFYVTTMNDIKIYDKYGQLTKRFKKLLENEQFEPGTKIRDFIFDINYRKFYVGFSNGAIIQYNAGNGSPIKVINQIEYEKNGMIYYKYEHSKDITNLYYFYSKNEDDQETILLFSTSLDSTMQIYDERDYDNSIKLKTYLNAHTANKRKCEINCMDYNYNLSQLATGSTYGMIVIWNFNNMKINDIYYTNYKTWGIRLDVTCLKYFGKYPLLFASYSEGICIIWTVKPLKGEAILKFQNFYQTLTKLDVTDVTCCLFYDDVIKDVEEKFLNKLYFVDEPEFIEERNKPRYDKITGEELPPIKRETVEKKSETDAQLDPTKINTNKKEEDDDDNNNNKSFYLLICDKKGFMKILNIKGIFHTYLNNFEMESGLATNFSLLKKEVVDVGPIKSHLLQISQVSQEKDYEKLYTNLYTSHIITREWRGHSDFITALEFIDDPVCTITISKDKYLRIWDDKFELIGEINVLPDESGNNMNRYLKERKVEWGFKVNEKKLLEKEVAEFVRILENIEIKEETKIIKGSKIDKDFNNPELYEIDDKEGLIPKRIKPQITEDKNSYRPKYVIKSSENQNENKDDYENQNNFEAINLKNKEYQIDIIINNEPEKEGLGELSNNLIKSLIEKKEKFAKLKKLKISDFNKLSNPKEITDKKTQNRRDSFFSIKKSQLSKSNLIFINPEQNANSKENQNPLIHMEQKPKKSLNINFIKKDSFKRESDKNLIQDKDNKSTFSSGFRGKSIEINNIKKPEEKPLSKTTKSLFRNKFKTTFSDINIVFKPDKTSNFFNKPNYTLNRNILYAQKFASKSFYNPKDKDKVIKKEQYRFPRINSTTYLKDKGKIFINNKAFNNLNFESRKKTEDLIKTQLYFNNYKNTFKLNQNYSDISSNKTNAINSKYMWNKIKLYPKNMLKKTAQYPYTLNFNRTAKNLHKSKSAFNIKSS